MDGQPRKIKSTAILATRVLLTFLGWCLIMVVYTTIYNQLEANAVPVTVYPFRDFSAESWDQGYFHAKGSMQNDTANNAGEELVLATSDISCFKDKNQCVIATGDVFNSNLNLDVSTFDIDFWNDDMISFHDDSSICASNAYVINRKAESFNITVRKKAVIPDYALKSPLRPCDHMTESNQALVKGSKVYDQKIATFERANLFYLHLFLVALNLAYLAIVFWSFRRRFHVA